MRAWSAFGSGAPRIALIDVRRSSSSDGPAYRPTTIMTVPQPSLVGEIAERLTALQLGPEATRRTALVIPLKVLTSFSVSIAPPLTGAYRGSRGGLSADLVEKARALTVKPD
jgi:hypothetical protein